MLMIMRKSLKNDSAGLNSKIKCPSFIIHLYIFYMYKVRVAFIQSCSEDDWPFRDCYSRGHQHAPHNIYRMSKSKLLFFK